MIELTLDMAERAAKAALAKAKQLGTVMTASVVDESGRTVLIMRGDGAGFFSPETSRKKAVAAANFRKPTKDLGEQAAKGSSFWAAVPAALAGDPMQVAGFGPAHPVELRFGVNLFAIRQDQFLWAIVRIALGAVRDDAHDQGVYHLCLRGKATKGHSVGWKFSCRLPYG